MLRDLCRAVREFITLRRTVCNLKCIRRSFLELSIEYFWAVVDHGKLKPRRRGADYTDFHVLLVPNVRRYSSGSRRFYLTAAEVC